MRKLAKQMLLSGILDEDPYFLFSARQGGMNDHGAESCAVLRSRNLIFRIKNIPV